MIKTKKILGLLGLAARARKICFGTDSVIEQATKKKAKLIIVAQDSSDRTKNTMKRISDESKIPICIIGTIEENSKAIGKKNKAVIGVKENHLANEIQKIYNRG